MIHPKVTQTVMPTQSMNSQTYKKSQKTSERTRNVYWTSAHGLMSQPLEEEAHRTLTRTQLAPRTL